MRDRKIVNLMLNKLHQRIIPQCAAMQFALGMGNKEQAIPRMGEQRIRGSKFQSVLRLSSVCLSLSICLGLHPPSFAISFTSLGCSTDRIPLVGGLAGRLILLAQTRSYLVRAMGRILFTLQPTTGKVSEGFNSIEKQPPYCCLQQDANIGPRVLFLPFFRFVGHRMAFNFSETQRKVRNVQKKSISKDILFCCLASLILHTIVASMVI